MSIGRRPPTRATRLLAVLLSAPAACALRSIQLKQLDTGKDVFPGGAKEAGCSACIAVMEDIALEMGQPVDSVDEGVTNLAEYRAAKAGKRSAVERARRDEVNTELFVQQVLNPKRCHPAMQKYDLGFIQNRHLFVRKPENGDGHYPIHMELNEVAKYELHQYCEAFMEELEDELTALVVANASDLIYKACFVEFKQCSKAKPKSEKAKAKAKRAAEKEKEIAKAREVFDAIDTDKNGLLTRAESAEHMKFAIEAAEEKAKTDGAPAPKARDADADSERFFAQADRNSDGWISFNEYKKLWLPPKPAKLKFSVLGRNYSVPLSLTLPYLDQTIDLLEEEAKAVGYALAAGVTIVPFSARLLGGTRADAFAWTLVVLCSVLPGIFLGKLATIYLDRNGLRP